MTGSSDAAPKQINKTGNTASSKTLRPRKISTRRSRSRCWCDQGVAVAPWSWSLMRSCSKNVALGPEHRAWTCEGHTTEKFIITEEHGPKQMTKDNREGGRSQNQSNSIWLWHYHDATRNICHNVIWPGTMTLSWWASQCYNACQICTMVDAILCHIMRDRS